MGVYIVELLIIFILGVFLYSKKISRKSFVRFSSIIMGLVLGLRSTTTAIDTVIYINIFNYIKKLSWSEIFGSGYYVIYNYLTWSGDSYRYGENTEIGYAIINKLCSYFMSDHIFILTWSIVLCVLFGNFILKNMKDHVFLALFIFMCEALYMNSFNLFRQLIAMSIAINSLQCFKKNNNKRGIFRIVLGCLLHTSCVVLFLLPILMKCKEKSYKKFIPWIFYGALGCVISLPFIKIIVVRILPKYSLYLTTNFWTVSIGGTVIVWLLGIIIAWMKYHNRKELSQNDFIAISCFIIYIAFELMGFSYTMLARVGLYFRFSYMLLLPDIKGLVNNKGIKQIYFPLLIMILTMEYISYASVSNMAYSFFWR